MGSYELNNKKLYKEEKSRRKDVSYGLNISSNVMLLFIIVLFSCWNSAVFAFHLNEESNSVYPKMKSISSSSFSHKRHSKTVEVFYPSGNSEESLPVCSPNMVCNKVDTYGSPWVERQCRCPATSSGKPVTCSTSIHSKDGFTAVDRNRQYKMCEPAKKLKRCKYFRDVTWSYVTYPDQRNSTQQIMHCRCPKNSVAYLIKRHAFQTPKGTGYQYSFACSPQTKQRCQRKEPCRLFSVRKNTDRPKADEVSTNSLCSCPRKRKCPKHHLDAGVIPGKIYSDAAVRTYSAYCM